MTDPSTFNALVAQDPNTDPSVLWEIAQTRPDLRGNLAANPAIPTELAQWLDAQAAAPVQDAPATYAAQAAPGTYTAQTFSAGAVPSVPLPPQPPVSPEAVAYSPNAPLDAGAYVIEEDQQPKRSAKKWIVIGLIAALVVAGAVFLVNTLVFNKLAGSKTPDAAVTKLFESLEAQDLVAVYGSFAPSEVKLAEDSYTQFSKHFDSEPLGQDPKDFVADALKAYTFGFEDIELSVESINDTTARVQVTQGTINVDGDADKFSSVVSAALADIKETGLGTVLNDAGAEWPTDAEIKEEITKGFAENFPASIAASELVIPVDPYASLDFESFTDLDDLTADAQTESVPFSFVVAKEDKGWYVSPVRTLVDASAASTGETVNFSKPVQAVGSGSPEDAAAAWLNANLEGIKTLDFSASAQYLTENERLISGLALDSSLPVEDEYLTQALEGINIDPASFALDRTEGNTAYLTLESLKISGEIEGMQASVDISSQCANIAAGGMPMNLCIRDIPAALELGLDKIRLVAVKEDGKWFVSGTLSSADSMGIIASNVLRLAEEGHLTDTQWWMDNLGVLGQIANEF